MESEEVSQEMFDTELDFEEEAKEEKDASEEEEDAFSDVDTSLILTASEEVKIESVEVGGDAVDSGGDKEKKDGVFHDDTEKVSSNSGSESDGEISDSEDDKREKPKGKTEGKVGDDREEGECSDGDDHIEMQSNRPRIPCRFFNRGYCSWGMNCKFIHAGFNDKGNYRMFEPMKHPAAIYNNENIHPMRMMRPPAPIAPRPEPVETKQETAWERGLRHAKEMMKQAQQRKETDIDFEDKKMNLSLGEDDILKEDVLYTRPASPLFSRSDGEDEENYPVPRVNINMMMDRPPMQRRMPYQGARNFNGRGGGGGGPQQFRNDYNNQGYKGRGWGRGGEHYDERKRNTPGSGRGDEWSDPWMRKRSPNRRRKVSYSSGSSYTSSSRSRSRSYSSSSGSSRSSYSSYSSRSRGRGRSRTKSRSRSRLSPIARKEELYGKGMMNRPSSTKAKPPARAPAKEQAVKPPVVAQAPKEEPAKPEPKKLLDYNPSFQNPPAPEKAEISQVSAESGKENKKMSISPFGIHQAAPKTLPVNMLKKAKKVQKASKKSKKVSKKKEDSDSESDSSSSSSASSSSSSSSSSSDSEEDSRKKLKAKRKIVMDGREALANIVKISAMDALRLSGQKQQIKLKLKPSDGSTPISEPVVPTQLQVPFEPVPIARKRSTETIENEAPKAKKPTSSRREELLNQLKAIEDAIKKKRSKLQ